MAGRIQGITVEIGGDTTKLQTALKGVDTEIRNTQSQLRDVDKLQKLDPGNTELLAQKHRPAKHISHQVPKRQGFFYSYSLCHILLISKIIF